MGEASKSSSPLLIAVAWAVVVIPAGWGLKYTGQNAAKLFTAPTATVAQPIVPPGGSPMPEPSSSAAPK